MSLNLEGYTVEHSSFAISAPRTGTAINNIMDVAFPSHCGKESIYFQLKLPNNGYIQPYDYFAAQHRVRPT